ncbi:MAG: CAP domain-containing protein [Caldilineaceae bacterium]
MIYRQRPSWRWLLMSALVILSLYLSNFILLAERSFLGCGGEVVAIANATYEARISELVNQERATLGLPPMKINHELANAARYHAADMSQDDYFAHQTHDRQEEGLVLICEWAERIKGYYPGATALAENMARSDQSPESVMAGWMSNSEHRANILGNYREVGVGYYDQYWVQNLGERPDSYPVIINGEAQQTDSPAVTLYLYGDWQQMRLRNNDGQWSEWQEFHHDVNWTLDDMPGEQRVDVELGNGTSTVISSDTIWLTGVATPHATAIPTPFPTAPATTAIYLPTIQR